MAGAEVTLWTIQGGGHGWPEVEGRASVAVSPAGPTPEPATPTAAPPTRTPLPPTPTPRVAVVVPSIGATPTPATGSASPAPGAATGRYVRIGNTDGDAVRLRSLPSRSAPAIASVTEGTRVLALGTARRGDDLYWQRVWIANGTEGWIAADFLTPD